MAVAIVGAGAIEVSLEGIGSVVSFALTLHVQELYKQGQDCFLKKRLA